jgi:dihydrofolate reductase
VIVLTQVLREIKYFVVSSLDNFISRLHGSVDWLFMDPDYGMAEYFASVDVAVMGHKTFDRSGSEKESRFSPPPTRKWN